MELCSDCRRLKAAGARSDVPSHLSRIAVPKLEGKTAFHYACDACGAEWEWLRGFGWQMRTVVSEPRIARLLASARSVFGAPKR